MLSHCCSVKTSFRQRLKIGTESYESSCALEVIVERTRPKRGAVEGLLITEQRPLILFFHKPANELKLLRICQNATTCERAH